MLATPLNGLSKEVLEGSFMNGLKTKLRAEVQHKPIGLEQMMEIAQMVEERNWVTKVGQ